MLALEIGDLAQVASTATAVVALVVAQRNERRNQERFESQLAESARIAAATVRPLLALEYEGYPTRVSIILRNHGTGAAVIRKFQCTRGKADSTTLGDLFNLGRENVPFDEITDLPEPKYVPPQSAETLVRLRAEALIASGVSGDEALGLLHKLDTQINDFTMRVWYEDVLGNVIAEGADIS
jgi:hypothetical protein